MPDAILFDPASATVPNRVTQLRRSVQVSDLAGTANVLFDPPGLKALLAAAVPLAQMKVSAGTVIQLTAGDLTALAAQAATDATAQQAANLAALKTFAKARLQTQADQRDLILSVVEVMVSEINILRAAASLAPRTQNQVTNALKTAYEARVDTWT